MSVCKVDWCHKPVFATGLCRTHYKQVRKYGEVQPRPKQPGDKSGYGVYGELTYGPDGRVMCHECGEFFQSVGGHLHVHEMLARDYKRKHGLRQATGLVSARVSADLSQSSQANMGTESWEKFVARRDPDAAQKARTPESHASKRANIGDGAEAARKNIEGQSKPRMVRLCPVCGREITGKGWRTCGDDRCALVHHYHATGGYAPAIKQAWNDGVRGDSEVARMVGCTPQNVRSQRLRRDKVRAAMESLRSELGDLPIDDA